jgi:hypothetical protein
MSGEDKAGAINWETHFRSQIGVTMYHTGQWNNAIFFSKNPSYLTD